MATDRTTTGKPAAFGGAAGAGARRGHPLPASEEARHGEIPEHLERDKGCGDDSGPANQPAGAAVDPDGEPYPAGGPGPARADGR